MSAATTPSKAGRGIAVPALDMVGSNDKMSTAFTYGGWLTPPQSAHESRRPSLHSIASSVSTFSQPTTPIHSFSASQEVFANQWTANDYANNVCTSAPTADHILHATIDQNSTCHLGPASAFGQYTPSTPTAAYDAFGLPMMPEQASQDTWIEHHQEPTGYNEHNSALQSMLFTHSHDFVSGPETASTYGNPSSSVLSPSLNITPTASHDEYSIMPTDCYQPMQVVVPSQVSPMNDPGVQQYTAYDASPEHSDSFTSSFDSADVALRNYDSIRPPSPIEDYVGYAEGEDYTLVKRECFGSPTPESSSLESRRCTRRKHPVRSKNRSSRRPRNKGPERLRLQESLGCNWIVEGKGLIKAFQDSLVTGELRVPSEPSVKKPHACPELNPDGTTCGERFQRSEHLKRHLGKHSDERPWPCPVPGCRHSKGTQRGDNATDHFKTHLKQSLHGVRNPRKEWPELKDLLLKNLPKKQAEKLIRNIERWILDKDDAKHQRHYILG